MPAANVEQVGAERAAPARPRPTTAAMVATSAGRCLAVHPQGGAHQPGRHPGGEVQHHEEVREDRHGGTDGDPVHPRDARPDRAEHHHLGGVEPLPPRCSVHRARRAGQRGADLVRRAGQQHEREHLQREHDGLPARPQQHPHDLRREHEEQHRRGSGDQCDERGGPDVGRAQPLAVVANAGHGREQHLVRRAADHRRGLGEQVVRAGVHAERRGAEHARDDEVVGVLRPPVAQLGQRVARPRSRSSAGAGPSPRRAGSVAVRAGPAPGSRPRSPSRRRPTPTPARTHRNRRGRTPR